MIVLKTKEEIEKMRAAGQVVAAALIEVAAGIVPGKTTTFDLDVLAGDVIARHGAIPSFKGYRGYPAVICAAVNEQVVHGIPGPRVLNEGDIVGIDLGAILDGYHGDSAITIPVGKVSSQAADLLRVTRESLFVGIKEAKVGNRMGDIGCAIQKFVESQGYSVVRDLVGHGIGREMHEDPQVPNFGRPGKGVLLQEWMTLAIEPMVNAGTYQVEPLSDGWTIVTRDGKLSAHFEHTIAITENGPEILTIRPGETLPFSIS